MPTIPNHPADGRPTARAAAAAAGRLVPAAVALLPAAVGYLAWCARGRGLVGEATALSLSAAAGTVLVAALIRRNAAALARMDRLRRRAERRLGVQHAAGRALAGSSGIDGAMPRILEALCDSPGWAFGAVWWVDATAGVLRCGDVWAAPGSHADEFLARCRRSTFARGVGLLGRAWGRGRPEWTADVVLNPDSPRADAAARSGLHGGFAFPIVADGEVLGVVEAFSVEARPPDEDLLRDLADLGGQIGQAHKRRQAEEALRRGEERFRSLVEATAAIVWSTPESGQFEEEQPGWTAFTGQTFEQLGGWGWLDAVHPDDRPETERVWSAAVASRSLYQVEHRLRRHDGEYRHMLVRAVPILGEGGAIREWIGVHTDIDPIKKAEGAMREAKEAAEAAAKTKSEFLANMSHEIRTPLNGIIGMSELALGTELTADQREFLGLVKASADHLLTVINDILDFSKIEAGKLDLEDAPFRLREALDDTVATLALRAHEKGLELASRVAADVPDALIGDAHRLRQVLVNLIGNAVKFTDGGEVVVEVEALAVADGRARLRFGVRDTGIGIDPEAQGRLFQAFSQADASTTRKYGGTGLGLAISSRLVGMMGGEIGLESEPGRGSTFHFTATFGLASGPAAVPGPPEPVEVRGLPVLVVDDNATNRRILFEMLANWGMRPTAVPGGREALEALERARAEGRPFGLVLLDAMMPEMDGFELAGRIGQDGGAAGPTLMMLSSANRGEDAARCRELAVSCYLTKPVRQSALLNAIMSALGASAEIGNREGEAPAPPAPAGPRRPLRLLLAEDNPVNQRLAVGLLGKRGHEVVVVGNGREALRALDGRAFDAVLMDVQMPEMDGFEATAAIRERDAATGARTRVVAMTAHALKGDRERCLGAGMDDYVTKPLRPQELDRVLEGLAPGDDGGPPPPPEPTTTTGPFDLAFAMGRVDGDVELLREMAALFLDECPRLLAEVREGIREGDAPRVHDAAHALKGSVGSFGAGEAAEAARRLEAAGRERDWGRVEGARASLEAALGPLVEALAGLGRAGSA